MPKFAKHLKAWEEAGFVKTNQIKTPKLVDRVVICMFMCYSLDHAGDCYRMFNPKTKWIVIARDIRWLKSFFTTEAVIDGNVRAITWIDVEDDDIDPPPSDARESKIELEDYPEVNADPDDVVREGTSEGDDPRDGPIESKDGSLEGEKEVTEPETQPNVIKEPEPSQYDE